MARQRTQSRLPSEARATGRGVSRVARGKGFSGLFAPTPSSLAAAESVTLGAIVAYDLMGVNDKKLPRPGPIVATVAFYAMLAFLAAASATLRPAVVASGWVLTLAVLVTGRRGQGLVKLLASIAKMAAKVGQGQQGGGTS